ncbi:hypothetical protein [Pseudomonas indica]|uniref:hypothetical protein n=1 Tax=Pseudomonas indica TaxID=137658 RepID=UPI001C3EFEF8|nr:hypothetical protein [Pseudomonas indica]
MSELSVTCLLFDEDQLKALLSILPLIRKYLDREWQVDTDPSSVSDVVVVNLDDSAGGPLLEALVGKGVHAVGCARHPRLHVAGTLHRPFRGYEVLALLQEGERRAFDRSRSRPSRRDLESEVRRFALAEWPAEFREWPKEWWRVLAAIRTHCLSTAQIAQRCDLPEAEVMACLDILQERKAVSVRVDIEILDSAKGGRRPGFWRRIGARVSDLLGRL